MTRFLCRICNKRVVYHLAQWLRWDDMTAICHHHKEAREARGIVSS